MNHNSIDYSRTTNNKSIASSCPIAESTQLEESSKTSPKFPWGGKMPKRKFNTSPSLNMKHIQQSNYLSNSFAKSNPQVYIDAQSNGLASRIVMYAEQSAKKQKPLSNQTYNRSGDYPLIHLDKSKITYKPRRNVIHSSSKVKIAAPIKSAYEASTRSEILRTGHLISEEPVNTSITYQRSLSQGNEPLLPTNTADDADNQGTRSVLDALKEISRKRIHCSDSIVDNAKKHKESQDEIDSKLLLKNAGIKRQREANIMASNNNLSVEGQQKRICTKNNDILSSLSSSEQLMSPPKKKSNDISTLKKSSEIVHPVQKTVLNQPKHSMDLNLSKAYNKIETNHNGVSKIQPTITLFNKRYDASSKYNVSAPVQDDSDDESASISFIKPKDDLPTDSCSSKSCLNPAEKSKLQLMMSWLSGDLSDDDQDEIDSGATVEKSNKDKSDISTSTAVKSTTETVATKATEVPPAVPMLPPILTFNLTSAPLVATNTNDPVTSKPNIKDKPIDVALPSTVTSTLVENIVQTTNTLTQPFISSMVSSTAVPVSEPKSLIQPTISSSMVTIPQLSTSISFNSTVSPVANKTIETPKIGGFSFAMTSTTPKSSISKEPSPVKHKENFIGLTFSQASNSPISAAKPFPQIQFGANNNIGFNQPSNAVNEVKPIAAVVDNVKISSSGVNQSFSAKPTFAFGNSSIMTTFGEPKEAAVVPSMNFGEPKPLVSKPLSPTISVPSGNPATFPFGSQQPQTQLVPTANLNTTVSKPFSFGTQTIKPLTSAPSFGFGNQIVPSQSEPMGPAPEQFASSNPAFTASVFGVKAFQPLSQSSAVVPASSTQSIFSVANVGPMPTFSAFASNTKEPVQSVPQTIALNTAQTMPSIFGAATTTSKSQSFFGNSETKPIFGAKPIASESSGMFSNQTASKILFPAAATTHQQIQESANIFGGAAPTKNVFAQSSSIGASVPSVPLFGGIKPATAASSITKLNSENTGTIAPFNFGQSDATKLTQPATNIFSVPQPTAKVDPSKMFSFGSKTETQTQPNLFQSKLAAPLTTGLTQMSNVFGSVAATTQNRQTTTTAPTATNSPFFTNSTISANSPIATQASKPFSFGSNITPPNLFGGTPTATNLTEPVVQGSGTPFSFGAQTPDTTGNTNGNPNFNFSSPVQTTPNLFNAGPATSSSRGRPIRQATRRLK